MDAAQILLMPLVNTVSPTVSGGAPAAAETPAKDPFSQLLGGKLSSSASTSGLVQESAPETADQKSPDTTTDPSVMLSLDQVLQQALAAGAVLPAASSQAPATVTEPVPEQATAVAPAQAAATQAVQSAAEHAATEPSQHDAPAITLAVAGGNSVMAEDIPAKAMAQSGPVQQPAPETSSVPVSKETQAIPAHLVDVDTAAVSPKSEVSQEAVPVAAKQAVSQEVLPEQAKAEAAVIVSATPGAPPVQSQVVPPVIPQQQAAAPEAQPVQSAQSQEVVPVAVVKVTAADSQQMQVAVPEVQSQTAVSVGTVQGATPAASQQAQTVSEVPSVQQKAEQAAPSVPVVASDEAPSDTGVVQGQSIADAGSPAKATTEWWSYGRQNTVPAKPVQHEAAAGQHATTVEKQTTALSSANGLAEGAEKMTSEEIPAVERHASDAVQVKSVSDAVVQHPLSAAVATQQQATVAVEKVVESNRSALPEQVSRQVNDRLATHDFKQGKEQVSLTLNPENLGKIQMNFQMEQHNLRVEIVAENRAVRDALLQQTDAVKEALARQNITVEKFDVTTSGERAFQQQYQQSQQQRSLYGSLYERQGAGRMVSAGGTGVEGDYQVSEGMNYFAPQYESTFTYRA